MGCRRALLVAVVVGTLSFLSACAGSAGLSQSSLQPTPQVESSGFGPCTTAVAAETELRGAHTATTKIGWSPFGIAASPDGRYAFASGFGSGLAGHAERRSGGYVAVLSDRGFAPKIVRTIALGTPLAAGDALTHDGRYLLVASGNGAAVLDVARAESGKAHALIGFLTSPETRSKTRPSAAIRPQAGASAPGGFGSAIEVAVSPDDRFAFVSLEYQDEIVVFNFAKALASGFSRSAYLGAIPLGQAVVGMTISPDRRWLYATSELAAATRPTLGTSGATGADGTLSVIDLARAETKPSASVVSHPLAGCSPVRVAVSSNGRVVWVTARESDALLAFSAAKLVSDPKHALLARVRVGEAPVGLAVIDHGARIVVADSNRFNTPGRKSALTIVDIAAALAGKPALIGTAPAGRFPRELALEPNGRTLLVSNFASGEVEALAIDQQGS